MNTMLIRKQIPGILLLAMLLIWSACERDDTQGEGPASFEVMLADYISTRGVYFSSDILGNLDEVEALGFCWATHNEPGPNDFCVEKDVLPGLFSYRAEGLTPGSRWYARAFYVQDDNHFYSNTVSFMLSDSIADVDGNNYSTIRIGNQLWMGENLKTRHYNTGSTILSGTGLGNYSAMPEPAYWFWYDDTEINVDTLGLLYTWFVVTDARGICPTGYRVPDILDWQNMIMNLDALAVAVGSLNDQNRELSAVAGGMIKHAGIRSQQTGIWESPNGDAVNETGMSVLPSGLRDPSGAFDGKGLNAAFWSVTEENLNDAVMFYVHFFNGGIYANYFNKKSGYAVRCMKEAGL